MDTFRLLSLLYRLHQAHILSNCKCVVWANIINNTISKQPHTYETTIEFFVIKVMKCRLHLHCLSSWYVAPLSKWHWGLAWGIKRPTSQPTPSQAPQPTAFAGAVQVGLGIFLLASSLTLFIRAKHLSEVNKGENLSGVASLIESIGGQRDPRRLGSLCSLRVVFCLKYTENLKWGDHQIQDGQ